LFEQIYEALADRGGLVCPILLSESYVASTYRAHGLSFSFGIVLSLL
jgi:hypothetical protein